MLDTLRQVETPEGVCLHLHPAGVLPRAAAWAIDFGIRVAALMGFSTVFAVLGETGAGLTALAMFVLYWMYPVLFEVLGDGQTVGKRVVGLRVIHANGTPVSWLASIVRNLMRVVDMLPVLYGFGVAAGLIDAQGRRLGDMVAGTLVVHIAPVPVAVPPPDVPVLLPDLLLAPDEKAVIVAFAERAGTLTPERQEELANLLPQLTHAQGQLAVQRLLGLASGFLGRGR
jgi:uncharacterized RDD family membrane protein YckC